MISEVLEGKTGRGIQSRPAFFLGIDIRLDKARERSVCGFQAVSGVRSGRE